MKKVYPNGIEKHTTDCCAMCQISRLHNGTPKQDIKDVLDHLSIQKDTNVEVGITRGNGQTSVFTIVSPGEDILEQNLIDLGFVKAHTFERRKGYNEKALPPFRGNLKMYIKDL